MRVSMMHVSVMHVSMMHVSVIRYFSVTKEPTSRPVLGVGLPNVATQNIFKLFSSKESEHAYSSPSVKKTTHKKSFIYCWADKPAADFSFRFLS